MEKTFANDDDTQNFHKQLEISLQLNSPEDILLTPKQAVLYLNISQRGIEELRRKGGGPIYVKLGHRCVRYRLSDLRKWIAERLKTSTLSQ